MLVWCSAPSTKVPLGHTQGTVLLLKTKSVCDTRGGGGSRDNGPYTDSFPLPCHFQGGGRGGLGGHLEGAGGGSGPLHVWLEMAASA